MSSEDTAFVGSGSELYASSYSSNDGINTSIYSCDDEDNPSMCSCYDDENDEESEDSESPVDVASLMGKWVIFKLVVRHAGGFHEVLEHINEALPVEHFLDPDGSINSNFYNMVPFPLITQYLRYKLPVFSERKAALGPVILRQPIDPKDVSFLSKSLYVLENVARYIQEEAQEYQDKDAPTLVYVRLDGAAHDTYLSSVVDPPQLTPSNTSATYDGDDAPGPTTVAPFKNCPCGCHMPSFLCTDNATFYEKLFVVSLDDPNEMLKDLYDCRKLESLVEEARPLLTRKCEEIQASKRKTSKENSPGEENVCKMPKRTLDKDEKKLLGRMKAMVSNIVMELLRKKQVHAFNKSGAVVPLALTEEHKIKGKLFAALWYGTDEVVFDLKPNARARAKDAFKVAIHVCILSGRISKIVWNGVLQPVVCEQSFEGPLESTIFRGLRKKFLEVAERRGPEDGYIEPFHALPPVVDDKQMTFDQAKWILSNAKCSFQRDGAHTVVYAPVLVFGDIHGEATTIKKGYEIASCYKRGEFNLDDVRTRDGRQALFHFVPLTPLGTCLCVQTTIVFLGDFCDRGENSVPSLIHLALMRQLESVNVVALRGNHDTREMNGINKSYHSLQAECRERFGKAEGDKWWELFNDFLDGLPYAVTIKSKIYPDAKGLVCVHGGVCPTYPYLNEMNRVPRADRLAKFDHIMWSDPDEGGKHRDAYRGSVRGGSALTFGELTLDSFLEKNNARAMLRAHGEAAGGYEELWDRKVMTVNSCHSGGDSGSCVYVADIKSENLPLYCNRMAWIN
jgi:Calcineurin-like phosphoesterase